MDQDRFNLNYRLLCQLSLLRPNFCRGISFEVIDKLQNYPMAVRNQTIEQIREELDIIDQEWVDV